MVLSYLLFSVSYPLQPKMEAEAASQRVKTHENYFCILKYWIRLTSVQAMIICTFSSLPLHLTKYVLQVLQRSLQLT